MSLASIMNANGIIDVSEIITGSTKIRSGDVVFTQVIDEMTGMYQLISNTNKKLLSFTQEGLDNDSAITELIQTEVTTLLGLIDNLQQEINQLRLDANNRIAAENRFIDAFRNSIYIESLPGSRVEYDYTDLELL